MKTQGFVLILKYRQKCSGPEVIAAAVCAYVTWNLLILQLAGTRFGTSTW